VTPPDPAALARLGADLRRHGLTARAVAAWAGTARLAALPARLAALPDDPATPIAALLALVVRGAELAADRLRAPALIDALVAHDLVERAGDQLRARVAVLPLDHALLVCDRRGAPAERDLVCWPDDSSQHLALAIPAGRRAAWLDLGCGSAFAPLARPGAATRIAAVDLNERAVRYARLGAALSAIDHLGVAHGDLAAPVAPADLVTCNAPIPSVRHDPTAPIWRHTGPDLFDRLWPALGRAVRPAGLIIVHAVTEAILPALSAAPGERVVVTYTPEGIRGFAVAWWRPDGPARLAIARRVLTPDRPGVTAADRDEALAR
jgi:SAM-dependent methyltransferase